MRRCLAFLLILPLLCFTACRKADSAMQKALNFRRELLEHGGCSFRCDTTVDCGERVYCFSMDCTYDGETGFLTVAEPERIAGIQARCSGKTGYISFDDLQLEFPQTEEGAPSPMALPRLLGDTWKEDYIADAGADGGDTAFTTEHDYGEQAFSVSTVLRDNIPAHCEIIRNHRTVLSMELSEFTFTE